MDLVTLNEHIKTLNNRTELVDIMAKNKSTLEYLLSTLFGQKLKLVTVSETETFEHDGCVLKIEGTEIYVTRELCHVVLINKFFKKLRFVYEFSQRENHYIDYGIRLFNLNMDSSLSLQSFEEFKYDIQQEDRFFVISKDYKINLQKNKKKYNHDD